METTAVEFTSTVQNFNTNLWGHHLTVPEAIAKKFIIGDNKRVICTLRDTLEIRAALMASKRYWFILINKEVRNKTGLSEGDQVSIKLEKDLSEYGHDMPEELQVVMDQDAEGTAHFKSLTKGKQRSLIYVVSKVKNSESRINKALAIMEHLREVQGQLDFKALNETIKKYNNRNKLK